MIRFFARIDRVADLHRANENFSASFLSVQLSGHLHISIYRRASGRMINLISPRETTSVLSCWKNRITSPGGDRYIAHVAYRVYVNYDIKIREHILPKVFFLS